MELVPKNILFIVKIAQDLKNISEEEDYSRFFCVITCCLKSLFVLHTNLPMTHKWIFVLLCRMDGVIVPLVPYYFIRSRSVNRLIKTQFPFLSHSNIRNVGLTCVMLLA